MKPIRISINALGGQGGGTLADWIVGVAEANGWIAQSTSVPGVAQRTGATLYYIEICAPSATGASPVLALMPTPGDVDVVLALELMEAGRAIARGLVTPDRTTLIASSHRIFSIGEKSARGDGIHSAAEVLAACGRSARQLVMLNLEQIAERRGSIISAAALGALAASRALPFEKEDFQQAIARGARGTRESLAAFEETFSFARAPAVAVAAQTTTRDGRRDAADLPEPVRATATIGADRTADYQDRTYRALYLQRVARVCAAERAIGPTADWRFSREAARRVALWMTYEDIIRVADLKVRAERFTRVRDETKADQGQIVRITEYLHPRFEELCDALPRTIGASLSNQRWARRLFARIIERDWQVVSTGLRGFFLLSAVASLRRFRPYSLRFVVEQDRIESWLTSAVNAARSNYELGVEILRLQRLVKGYGDTHARGLRCFSAIMNHVSAISSRADAAARVRELHEAALSEDDNALWKLLGRASEPLLAEASCRPRPASS